MEAQNLTNNPNDEYLDFGEGWRKLSERFTKFVEDYNANHPDEEDVVILQMKEKFGRLRIYTMPYVEEVYNKSLETEEESARTCEVCGARSNILHSLEGPMRTRCAKCAEDEAMLENKATRWKTLEDLEVNVIREDKGWIAKIIEHVKEI